MCYTLDWELSAWSVFTHLLRLRLWEALQAALYTIGTRRWSQEWLSLCLQLLKLCCQLIQFFCVFELFWTINAEWWNLDTGNPPCSDQLARSLHFETILCTYQNVHNNGYSFQRLMIAQTWWIRARSCFKRDFCCFNELACTRWLLTLADTVGASGFSFINFSWI